MQEKHDNSLEPIGPKPRVETDIKPPAGAIQARLLPSGDSKAIEDEVEDLYLPEFYQHTLLCQMALPYRNPGNVRTWRRRIGPTYLDVQAGRLLNPHTGEVVDVGLPFGPKARLILCYLNALARKTRSPKIELGGSLTSFVTRTLQLDGGGRTIRSVKEQLIRLTAADFRFYKQGKRKAAFSEGREATAIMGFDMWVSQDECQRELWPSSVLWPSTVEFSEIYFYSLNQYSVHLDERAVARLAHSALALDIYAWLVFRLKRVARSRPVVIRWASLKEQFGSEYERMDPFKRAFRSAFSKVRNVYPKAQIALVEKGLRLYRCDLLLRRPCPICGSTE